MNASEVERIKGLISAAELESAKQQGQLEAIKAEWKKAYGTDDIKEIEKILADMDKELEKTNERSESLYNKLLESYDWDALAEELGED